MRALARVAMFGVAIALVCQHADAYGIFTLTSGRKDYASRYDAAGQLVYAGQSNADVYAFGKWAAFNALPPNVTNQMVTDALTGAASKWTPWAKVSFDNSGLNATGTGLLRLRYDSAKATGAHAYAFQGANAGEVGYAEVVIGKKPSAGADWNPTNFTWTVFHEVGHILGLTDLYENQAEDFVDHNVNAAANPNLEDASTRDNVMHRYNNGNDYSGNPTTDVDNDEAAGVGFIWGANRSQIVTGDLNGFNANGRRTSKEHHGGQTGGWWTYRGTFGNYLLADKPYIDIDFLGYTGDFQGTALGEAGAVIEYVGNQGGSVERFRVNKDSFKGNFILKLKSRYTNERRVNASVTTGGNGISFSRDRNLDGMAYETNIGGGQYFAKVYGPVPEPSSVAVLALGLFGFCRRKRS